MPAFHLQEGERRIGRYDVVGVNSADPARFVSHVALHNEALHTVDPDQGVKVVHMCPPFQVEGQMTVHAMGQVPLSNDEVREIAVWIEEIADEFRRSDIVNRWREQYQIDPPWTDVCDPNTGVRRYRRYSCAGFVLDAYQQVGIQLLALEKDALPRIDEGTLRPAYPEAFGRGQLLERWGIVGSGPWRIVLAGYVLHALNRSSAEIRREPYRAKAGDERF